MQKIIKIAKKMFKKLHRLMKDRRIHYLLKLFKH